MCSLRQVEAAVSRRGKGTRRGIYSIGFVYSGLRDHMPSQDPSSVVKTSAPRPFFSPIVFAPSSYILVYYIIIVYIRVCRRPMFGTATLPHRPPYTNRIARLAGNTQVIIRIGDILTGNSCATLFAAYTYVCRRTHTRRVLLLYADGTFRETREKKTPSVIPKLAAKKTQKYYIVYIYMY